MSPNSGEIATPLEVAEALNRLTVALSRTLNKNRSLIGDDELWGAYTQAVATLARIRGPAANG